MRKNNFFEKELDKEINDQIRMGLNDKTQCENMQKVTFTNELLSKLRHFKTDKILSCEGFNVSKNHHEKWIFYTVKTVKYNESIAKKILRKTCQEINEQDKHDVNLNIPLSMKKMKH